ncbi:unnamed protein product [Sphagnum jensenii]|uniref:Uncharacterized protein n=1 Tax=Sphagnum jensenii TaxID=128206 RepID=A0ABP1BH78_9BRYO
MRILNSAWKYFRSAAEVSLFLHTLEADCENCSSSSGATADKADGRTKNMRNTDSDREGVEVSATLHQQLSTCTPLPLHPPNAQLWCKLLLGLKTFVVYYIERS